jgi:hypothetical protein
MNDVRKIIYGTIILFFAVLAFWISIIYVSSCGMTLSCNQATAKIDLTPIPTLIPPSHAEAQMGGETAEFNKCQVNAADLIGAWVTAKVPETEPFTFTDVNGKPCEGTFAADVQPLFVENSLWYKGAIGCVSCHNSDFSDRSAGLDLTSYKSIQSGSGLTADSTSKGKDILGGGTWEKSTLYTVLIKQGLVAAGHSADSPATVLVVFAGQAATEATSTPAP